MISGPDRSLFAYALVTAAYWAFMLTDGALRMLVLLYFHINGFDPISLAFLFLLYEFMGMVTNLGAGWIAARYGLNLTLYAGLVLQPMHRCCGLLGARPICWNTLICDCVLGFTICTDDCHVWTVWVVWPPGRLLFSKLCTFTIRFCIFMLACMERIVFSHIPGLGCRKS